ncbi:MAG: phosphonate ABC transporter, permease protein PhnE [Solirubrobacteraceae bacterium]
MSSPASTLPPPAGTESGAPKVAPEDAERLLSADRRRRRRSVIGAALIVAVIGACSTLVGLFDVQRLSTGIPDIVSLIGEMLPPDFSDWSSWVRPLIDTLAMSVAGTSLAVALALPLALAAARTTAANPVVYVLGRGLLNTLRSIPELIMGIIFVAAVGFGALPGVLALGLHSVGMVGKFFAESIERADRAPIEAIRATGATQSQVVAHGIFPQVLPQMVDVAVYRWEYNFRASTVLGLVGAGGIGFELLASLRLLRYEEVAALLLVVLATVTVVDALGTLLRRRFA